MNVWAEVGGSLCVAGIIVEDAVEEVGNLGVKYGDTDSQGEGVFF